LIRAAASTQPLYRRRFENECEMGHVWRLDEVVAIARDDTEKWFESGIVVARSAPHLMIGATHSGAA
jgi:hypothetical protein